MKPTIGRIVTFVDTHDVIRAAIIVYVSDPTDPNSKVNLRVFTDETTFPHRTSVPKNTAAEGEAQMTFSWEWPARS